MEEEREGDGGRERGGIHRTEGQQKSKDKQKSRKEARGHV